MIEKQLPNYLKSSQNCCQAKKKCQNISTKAQFESAKYQHRISFETFKYVQQAKF
jgi:hypothetical protein